MPYRSSMAALIARVRILINDPAGASQIFADTDVQDVLDEGRVDVYNMSLIPQITYSGSTIQYLDYFSEVGGWETDYVLRQFLTTIVTPSSVEPITGHFQFAQTTLPPVAITGKTYDVYRSAADLLERMAAQWVMRYSMNVDGQSLQRGQVVTALQALAKTYRMQQRVRSITMRRGDGTPAMGQDVSLAPRPIDYMATGS